ncbi:hypothetical protein H8356DRAFT_1407637 [Neocallimastix lanati (nom. inval.)]|nr:hypothetical protein H8356DRAFT_1407637 [Neocallimastix sp. JGI-2020a]
MNVKGKEERIIEIKDQLKNITYNPDNDISLFISELNMLCDEGHKARDCWHNPKNKNKKGNKKEQANSLEEKGKQIENSDNECNFTDILFEYYNTSTKQNPITLQKRGVDVEIINQYPKQNLSYYVSFPDKNTSNKVNKQNTCWTLDSRTTFHMTNQLENLHNVKECNKIIEFANGGNVIF